MYKNISGIQRTVPSARIVIQKTENNKSLWVAECNDHRPGWLKQEYKELSQMHSEAAPTVKALPIKIFKYL